MRIFTCLKEVPIREAHYDLAESWIKDEGLTFELSECDEYALEQAVRLQEQHGGEVCLLTLGRRQVEKLLRKGLAMGAERAILIEDDSRRASSPYAVAAAFAAVLQDQQPDLILAGTQSDDYGYAQTGVMLAELLDLPHATLVMDVNANPLEKTLQVLREMESGVFERLQLPLPAVLTIQAGILPLRYPTIRRMMAAKKKEIRRVSLEELPLDWTDIPAPEVVRLYVSEKTEKAEFLTGDATMMAATLVQRLKEAKVI